jgi:hypothetical protein
MKADEKIAGEIKSPDPSLQHRFPSCASAANLQICF